MRIETLREDTTTVLRLHGFLAGPGTEALTEHLAKFAGPDAGAVALDVTGILLVDSRGLEVLVNAAEAMIRSGRTLRLLGKNPKLFEILELTELTPLFEVCREAEPAGGKRP